MAQVCAFFDELDEDGWGRVTRTHHQPDKLDEATRAAGVVITPTKPPKVRPGWTMGLHVRPFDGAHEWRVEIDADYREPIGEYLMRIPVPARVAARASTNPNIVEILRVLDMVSADPSARGIHPGQRAAIEVLTYFVTSGMLPRAVAEDIASPFDVTPE